MVVVVTAVPSEAPAGRASAAARPRAPLARLGRWLAARWQERQTHLYLRDLARRNPRLLRDIGLEGYAVEDADWSPWDWHRWT